MKGNPDRKSWEEQRLGASVRIPPSPPRGPPQLGLLVHRDRFCPEYRSLADRLGLGRPCPSMPIQRFGGAKTRYRRSENEVFQEIEPAHRCKGPQRQAEAETLQAFRHQSPLPACRARWRQAVALELHLRWEALDDGVLCLSARLAGRCTRQARRCLRHSELSEGHDPAVAKKLRIEANLEASRRAFLGRFLSRNY